MIGQYCERTTAGFWAEPANLLSNLAFAAAAWGLWRLRRGTPDAATRAGWFSGMAFAIAIASGLNHSVATPVARALDEGSIVLFQISALWRYARGVLRWRPSISALSVIALIGSSVAARILTTSFNGSVPYLPALLATFALGIDHRRAGRRGPWRVLAGSGFIAIGLLFRTIDKVVCGSFPTGTHFLWHILAASVVYQFGRAVIENDVGAAQVRSVFTRRDNDLSK